MAFTGDMPYRRGDLNRPKDIDLRRATSGDVTDGLKEGMIKQQLSSISTAQPKEYRLGICVG